MGDIFNIESHSETMVAENENVDNSKTELENKYMEYLEDNLNLTTDWQGDTADIFMKYSNNMNQALSAAIGTTGVFGLDINTFYTQCMYLDNQASTNVKGEN